MRRCNLFVSIILTLIIYSFIYEIHFTFDQAYAQSSQQNKIIEEEYINPTYNGQAPYSILYKVIIECQDTDNTCFDNILSQTGITGISAYFSDISANEPCVANIYDILCNFVRNNVLQYGSTVVVGKNVLSQPIIIRVNHNGVNITSGSLISPTITPFTDLLQFSKRTISHDVDKDSIPDEIELNGISDQNGNLVFDLPGKGADPCRKTILLELDYMERIFHSHIPTQESINKAIEMFNNAPVPAETGQNCPYDGFPKESSGVNLIVNLDDSIPEINAIDIFSVDTNGNPDDDFDTIKRNNFDPHLKPYFHYGLFAHQFIDPKTKNIVKNWGIGEIEGNDFILSFGDNLHLPRSIFTTFFFPLPEAGTLAHELGHNLKLLHGGGDNINCKPNYLSVMNYVFGSGLAKNEFGSPPFIDYSREKLSPLFEAHLNENDGISDGDLLTIWREPRPNGPILLGAGNMPLNWNNNFHGFLNLFPNIEDDVSVNINTALPGDCENPQNFANETLNGFNDWENIDYNFRDSIENNNYAQGLGGEYVIEGPFENLEQSVDVLEDIYSADLEVTKHANLSEAIPGDVITYTVTVKNIGNNQATNISVVDTFPDGTIENRTLENLNPGESKTEIFNFTVPQLKPVTYEIVLVNTAEVNGLNILGLPDNILENNKANASTVIPTSEISSIAKCNLGDNATGGGFVLDGNAIINSSKPLNTEDGWNATALVFGKPGITKGSTGNVTAHVVCLDR
jgi:uncharacterized repeat protein (TIGR01451 family)